MSAGGASLAGVFAGLEQEEVDGAARSSPCAVSAMEQIFAGTSGTCWPEGELGGIQLCLVLCLHLRHCLDPSVVSGGAVRTVSRV